MSIVRQKALKGYKMIKLVDEMGEIDTQIKVLEEQLKEMKAEFKSRGVSEFKGDLYKALAYTGHKVTMPKDVVVAKLGQKWYDKNSKVSAYEAVKIEALKSSMLDEEAA